MSKVDSDPRIQELFAKVTKVIILDRTVRGEFELVKPTFPISTLQGLP